MFKVSNSRQGLSSYPSSINYWLCNLVKLLNFLSISFPISLMG